MAFPTKVTTYVIDGVNLLTSRYRNLKIVPGVVTALMLALQELENAAWSVIEGILLTTPPVGDAVDRLAALVGITRDGRTDTQLLAAIQIQIRINRSHGLAEDIIGIAALVVANAVYREWPTMVAAWEIDLLVTPPTTAVVQALTQYLGKARSAGTAGNIRYAPDAGSLLCWGSNVGTVPDAEGFGDSVSGLLGHELAGLNTVN